ncbi:hypothetical protein [Plantactinospora sonchi]|uniref:Lipopolysaccharide biosynthesis protein n=1 Tax=Plantactinospora sonchi TaxID=1544735 RepID=A0ABU7RMT4_9ACTN
MDLLDLLKLMFRRWYVSAPIVVGTLGAAFAFGLAIQPEYKTEAAILLVPPTTAQAAPEPDATPQPGNPWLRLGENQMAQAVQISISSHDARMRVAAAGGDPDYEVGLVTRSSILTVAVTAATEQSARATVIAVTQLLTDEVAGKQAEYQPRPGEQITTQVLDPGLNIVPSRSNVLRAQVVIAAIGLLLAAVAAVVYDAVLRRRAAARLGRRDPRTPMTWNGGQAAVGANRSGGQPSVTPAPAARSAPSAPGGRDATQPLSAAAAKIAGRPGDDRGPAYPGDHDRAAGHLANGRAAHAAEERGPGPDRTGDRGPAGPPTRGGYRSAPQSDETILLTTVRNPAEDSSQ